MAGVRIHAYAPPVKSESVRLGRAGPKDWTRPPGAGRITPIRDRSGGRAMKMGYEGFKIALDAQRKQADRTEFWLARDLRRALGYDTWENFDAVRRKAMVAAESAGEDPADHF